MQFGTPCGSNKTALHHFIQMSNQSKTQTHEAGRIRLIRSHFAVNLHQPLVDDLLHFVVRQSVLQTVSQEHGKRQAFTKPVWTTAWTRGLKCHAAAMLSRISSMKIKTQHQSDHQ